MDLNLYNCYFTLAFVRLFYINFALTHESESQKIEYIFTNRDNETIKHYFRRSGHNSDVRRNELFLLLNIDKIPLFKNDEQETILTEFESERLRNKKVIQPKEKLSIIEMIVKYNMHITINDKKYSNKQNDIETKIKDIKVKYIACHYLIQTEDTTNQIIEFNELPDNFIIYNTNILMDTCNSTDEKSKYQNVTLFENKEKITKLSNEELELLKYYVKNVNVNINYEELTSYKILKRIETYRLKFMKHWEKYLFSLIIHNDNPNKKVIEKINKKLNELEQLNTNELSIRYGSIQFAL
jgi:hypothetical protein